MKFWHVHRKIFLWFLKTHLNVNLIKGHQYFAKMSQNLKVTDDFPMITISTKHIRDSRKLYVVDLANDIPCNFSPEAVMNTVSTYEAAYWL